MPLMAINKVTLEIRNLSGKKINSIEITITTIKRLAHSKKIILLAILEKKSCAMPTIKVAITPNNTKYFSFTLIIANTSIHTFI
jgi:hypothetical protein